MRQRTARASIPQREDPLHLTGRVLYASLAPMQVSGRDELGTQNRTPFRALDERDAAPQGE